MAEGGNTGGGGAAGAKQAVRAKGFGAGISQFVDDMAAGIQHQRAQPRPQPTPFGQGLVDGLYAQSRGRLTPVPQQPMRGQNFGERMIEAKLTQMQGGPRAPAPEGPTFGPGPFNIPIRQRVRAQGLNSGSSLVDRFFRGTGR